MIPDCSDIFSRYEKLVAECDAVFAKVQSLHPDCVTCGKGCSDCCHALFDLTLVEAMYLNTHFAKNFKFGAERSAIVERAGDSDRRLTKLKRQANKDYEKGVRSANEILEEMSLARERCPLLNDDGACVMYDNRPITCRLYGIPSTIAGKAHSCSKSGFKKGVAYPSVQMEKIQDKLMALSYELQEHLKSRYDQLYTVLVPVSMVLLTQYNEQYLGIDVPKKEGAR